MMLIRYAVACLLIALFQTSIVHFLPFSGFVFNPALPYILYVCLMKSNRAAFGVAIGLGLFMDGLSGAPFGLYTTAYVWMAVIVRQMTALIRADQAGMIQLLVGLGVLFETMVVLILTAMIVPEFRIPFHTVKRIGMQMLLAAVFAPFLFSLFYRLQGTGEDLKGEARSRSGRKW